MTDNDNPLIPAVLQVLRESDQRLAIHQLLQGVKAITAIPELDDDVQMALFKLNWLMMNALYQLQVTLLQEGYYLVISTLDIHLEPLQQADNRARQRQLERDPLRDYYLDWSHFSDTTREQVEALMDGVWQHYISGDQEQKAYQVLGLSSSASMQMIRRTYRRLAGLHHPDKGGDALQFMEVRQAYEVLVKARGHR